MNPRPIVALLLCLSLSCPAWSADASKKAGSGKPIPWIALFDGKSTAGWRGFGKATFPEHGWIVALQPPRANPLGPQGCHRP